MGQKRPPGNGGLFCCLEDFGGSSHFAGIELSFLTKPSWDACYFVGSKLACEQQSYYAS